MVYRLILFSFQQDGLAASEIDVGRRQVAEAPRRTHAHARRYLPLQDDIASVAFWYQTLPTSQFPPLPDRDYLEVI
jgi:hypothetical protein